LWPKVTLFEKPNEAWKAAQAGAPGVPGKILVGGGFRDKLYSESGLAARNLCRAKKTEEAKKELNKEIYTI
jgi:hypothetical protein